MARILINDQWYEELSPSSLYESEYETVILRHANIIYPDFFIVPFKLTVFSDTDSARADLALISRAYDNWWVVEVEREDHSLKGHVIPQIQTLSQAHYDKRVAEYLVSKCRDLNLYKVLDMLKGLQPKVLVMVNRPMPEWIEALKRFEAELSIIEIFRSEQNKAVFRVNGFHPTASTETLSICEFDKFLPRFLEVQSPAVLPKDSDLKIVYDGRTTQWKRIDTADKVWLTPERASPLNPQQRYELVYCSDGSLVFRDCTE